MLHAQDRGFTDDVNQVARNFADANDERKYFLDQPITFGNIKNILLILHSPTWFHHISVQWLNAYCSLRLFTAYWLLQHAIYLRNVEWSWCLLCCPKLRQLIRTALINWECFGKYNNLLKYITQLINIVNNFYLIAPPLFKSLRRRCVAYEFQVFFWIFEVSKTDHLVSVAAWRFVCPRCKVGA